MLTGGLFMPQRFYVMRHKDSRGQDQEMVLPINQGTIAALDAIMSEAWEAFVQSRKPIKQGFGNSQKIEAPVDHKAIIRTPRIKVSTRAIGPQSTVKIPRKLLNCIQSSLDADPLAETAGFAKHYFATSVVSQD